MRDIHKQIVERFQMFAKQHDISPEEISNKMDEYLRNTEVEYDYSDIDKYLSGQFKELNCETCRKPSKYEDLQAELTILQKKYGNNKEN